MPRSKRCHLEVVETRGVSHIPISQHPKGEAGASAALAEAARLASRGSPGSVYSVEEVCPSKVQVIERCEAPPPGLPVKCGPGGRTWAKPRAAGPHEPSDELIGQIMDAVQLLRENEPPEGYYGAFSGGKDSVVIKELARLAGVNVTWHYNKTTIDPPELVQFIKREHPDVVFERPTKGTFFQRLPIKGFPTRKSRWCCDEMKESVPPPGSSLILGVRAEESAARAKHWKPVQAHHKTGAPTVQPILHWGSDDIWAFIRGTGLSYSSLYDEGFHRLGCVGCPQARQERRRQFERWPQIEKKWKQGFKEIWDKRSGSITVAGKQKGEPWWGDRYFDSWEEMWEWWLSDKPVPPRRR